MASSNNNIDFPPLPPLPYDSNRRSAPPTTTPFIPPPGTSRLRSRRSRVSFREEVERPRSSASSRKATTPTSAYTKLSAAPPKLKRASSTAALGVAAGALTTDDFDAFRPQTLRYPKMPSALARLSDTSVPPASTWSSRRVTAPARTRTSAPESHFVSEFGQVDVPPRERTVSQTSSRKGKTRSPIPSWSSTCPSLVNSRASIASTLTAPSMTSLLLSPQSPHEVYLPSKDEQQAFEDHIAPQQALEDSWDMHESSEVEAKESTDSSNSVTETKSRAPSRRLRPSDTLQPPPPPPTSFAHTPRAERLLRLQNSLADLRMQRSMTRSPEPTEESQEATLKATPRLRQRPSLGAILTTPNCKIPSPPSPTFGDLVRSAPRSAPGSLKGRRRTTYDSDESDLDLTLPPLNAALRSHVIPSSSRLLVSKGRTHETTSGLGWSGSESEEEEFARTVARIASRKNTPRKLQKRPSLPGRALSLGARHSYASRSPATPSLADRPASAIGTMRPTGAALLALVEQKYASTQALPRPKKYVTGWGAPEVLHDDEWPDALEEVAEGDAW